LLFVANPSRVDLLSCALTGYPLEPTMRTPGVPEPPGPETRAVREAADSASRDPGRLRRLWRRRHREAVQKLVFFGPCRRPEPHRHRPATSRPGRPARS